MVKALQGFSFFLVVLGVFSAQVSFFDRTDFEADYNSKVAFELHMDFDESGDFDVHDSPDENESDNRTLDTLWLSGPRSPLYLTEFYTIHLTCVSKSLLSRLLDFNLFIPPRF